MAARGRPRDEARRALARELRSQGLSYADIRERMPGTGLWAIQRWVQDVPLSAEQGAELDRRWRASRFQEREDPRAAEARKLRAEGASLREIGAAVGAAPSAVRRWVLAVALAPAAQAALQERRVDKARTARARRTEEEGVPPMMHMFRSQIPPDLPPEAQALAERVLGADYLDTPSAVALSRAIASFDLVPVDIDEEERCARLLRRIRAGRSIDPSLYADPPIDAAVVREIIRAAYAAARARSAPEVEDNATRAIGLLRRSGLALMTRARASFCSRARAAVRKRDTGVRVAYDESRWER